MSLKIVFDECLRSDALWAAVEQHNQSSDVVFDAVRVGDSDGPATGTQDPDLPDWAADHNRIVLSQDRNSLPGHLRDDVDRNHRSPGVILIPPMRSMREIVEALAIVSHCCDAFELENQCVWLPA